MISTEVEHKKVVEAIRDGNSAQFTVLTNLEKEEHYIGPMFPDLIFLEKQTEKPIFIVEVKRNGGIAGCIQQWKSQPSIPATLYIIVPESDLSNAKSIAQVVGLKARFGSYKFTDSNVQVKYE